MIRMREILFRGKRNDTGEWVEGFYVCAGGKLHYILVGKIHIVYGNVEFIKCIVDPANIGQYTGLKDRNGKRIFEGDIIQHGAEPAKVCFGEYAFDHEMKTHVGFYLEWINKTYYRIDFGFWANEREIEVIGNIHDNPELLKEG